MKEGIRAKIQIVECPRDAMQGIRQWIPTEVKVRYLNALLKVGFDILDAGSFVSPRAVPQMKDTPEVLRKLNLASTSTKILVIVATARYAQEACGMEQVSYLGYPFSVSEEFMRRNLRSTREDGLREAEKILRLAEAHGKKVVFYLSMAFGNPYGEPWSVEEVIRWGRRLSQLGNAQHVLADTTGESTPERIRELCSAYFSEIPQQIPGIHLHTSRERWKERLEEAWKAGIRRFDCALGGYGGCPFAREDRELLHNLPTEWLILFLEERGIPHGLDMEALRESLVIAREVFPEPG